jgi:hypothetical protein
MPRIPTLNNWILPNGIPSAYDWESATALERTAKLNGAVQMLIEDYNKFIDELTAEIKSFTGSTAAEIAEFKQIVEQRLRCKFEDLDARIAEFNIGVKTLVTEEAERVYTEHVDGYIDQAINEKIVSGDIELTLVYDPETESLSLTTGGAQ